MEMRAVQVFILHPVPHVSSAFNHLVFGNVYVREVVYLSKQ